MAVVLKSKYLMSLCKWNRAGVPVSRIRKSGLSFPALQSSKNMLTKLSGLQAAWAENGLNPANVRVQAETPAAAPNSWAVPGGAERLWAENTHLKVFLN